MRAGGGRGAGGCWCTAHVALQAGVADGDVDGPRDLRVEIDDVREVHVHARVARAVARDDFQTAFWGCGLAQFSPV